jgi:hypothetical protein
VSSIRVSERERKCLVALAQHHSSDGLGFIGFKTIAAITGIEKPRRYVRALARKGLAEYGRGLWSADGEPGGSGYASTEVGFDLVEKDLEND